MNREAEACCTPDGCCKPMDIPTDDEVKALNALKSIKEKVRDLKKKLAEMPDGSDEKNAIENRLEQLKHEWEEWEEKRKEATRIRMILLGHEEP